MGGGLGYTIEIGGAVEESAEGLHSIAVVFPLMIFVLMLSILMVQPDSFQKMSLAISIAP